MLFTCHLASYFDSTITLCKFVSVCDVNSLVAKAITIIYVGVAIHISLSFVCFLFTNGILQIKQVIIIIIIILVLYFCFRLFCKQRPIYIR